jgi:hypothetical protein
MYFWGEETKKSRSVAVSFSTKPKREKINAAAKQSNLFTCYFHFVIFKNMENLIIGNETSLQIIFILSGKEENLKPSSPTARNEMENTIPSIIHRLSPHSRKSFMNLCQTRRYFLTVLHLINDGYRVIYRFKDVCPGDEFVCSDKHIIHATATNDNVSEGFIEMFDVVYSIDDLHPGRRDNDGKIEFINLSKGSVYFFLTKEPRNELYIEALDTLMFNISQNCFECVDQLNVSQNYFVTILLNDGYEISVIRDSRLTNVGEKVTLTNDMIHDSAREIVDKTFLDNFRSVKTFVIPPVPEPVLRHHVYHDHK